MSCKDKITWLIVMLSKHVLCCSWQIHYNIGVDWRHIVSDCPCHVFLFPFL